MYWIQRYSQISPAAGSSMKTFKRVACTDGGFGTDTGHTDSYELSL